ncbi:MAG: T9SS type A sorting domain-containing protein, partial [Bacteroidales bacterium]|nr:T9SS type A sorting domain-containing protein [Bacteroidales bacterium]
KIRIFILPALMLAFTGAKAQYTGGDGRGDIALTKASTKLGNSFVINGNWSIAGNWSAEVLPGTTETTHIMADAALDQDVTLSDLFIHAGNSLTILSGKSLITTGTLTNNGTVTLQRSILGDNAWHMISGPAVADISDNSWNPVSGQDDFYAWHEQSPGTWVNYLVTDGELNFPGVNGSDNFEAGKGYLVSYQTSGTVSKSISATPNTGNQSFTLKHSGGTKAWDYAGGWNLLGNPYPSGIDWHLADKNLFKDVFAYAYNPNKDGGGGYETIDGSNANAYIAPFQGFFVLAENTSNDKVFTFTNAMRAHGGTFYKNQTAGEGLVLRLGADNWYNETAIRLRQESENTRDRLDALKMYSFNPEVPQLYSLSADGVPLAVNSIPGTEAGAPIALGVKIPAQGTYSISLQQNDQTLAPAGLFIEDRLENVFHKISDQPFAFTASEGDFADRFYLHFGMVNLPENSSASKLLIYQQGNLLQLVGTADFTQLQLFDSNGRLLSSSKLHPADRQQLEAPTAAGVYVLKLIGVTQTHSQKVVVY